MTGVNAFNSVVRWSVAEQSGRSTPAVSGRRRSVGTSVEVVE